MVSAQCAFASQPSPSKCVWFDVFLLESALIHFPFPVIVPIVKKNANKSTSALNHGFHQLLLLLLLLCLPGQYQQEQGPCQPCDQTCLKCAGPGSQQCISCASSRSDRLVCGTRGARRSLDSLSQGHNSQGFGGGRQRGLISFILFVLKPALVMCSHYESVWFLD